MDAATSRLIGDLYQSVVEPGGTRALLHGLGSLIGAPMTGLLYFDNDRICSSLTSSGSLPDSEARYLEQFAARDVIADALLRKTRGHAYLRRHLVPDEHLHATAIYQEFMRHVGGEESISGLFAAGNGWTGVVTLTRLPGETPFSDADRQRLEDLLPHFGIAGRIQIAVGEARSATDALFAAFESFAFGIIVVDRNGVPLFANSGAEAAFSEAGSRLTTRAGRLSVRSAGDSARLARMIAAATSRDQPTGGGMTLRREPHSLVVLCLPLPASPKGLPSAAPAALLLLVEPKDLSPAVQTELEKLYRLTPMEARIAVALSGGSNVQEIADSFALSRETIRFHLKGIFTKLEARSQSDVVRLITRSLGMITWNRQASFEVY